MPRLIIQPSCWSAMLAHAAACSPEECCGLASGKNGRVTSTAAIENTLHSGSEFRMDASGQVREMMRIDEAGMEMLAIYHSHPQGPEMPSQTDIDRFMYPESYSIILFPRGGTWTGRCFKIGRGSAEEIDFSVME